MRGWVRSRSGTVSGDLSSARDSWVGWATGGSRGEETLLVGARGVWGAERGVAVPCSVLVMGLGCMSIGEVGG